MNKPFTPFLTSSSPSAPAASQSFQAAVPHVGHGAAAPAITLQRDGDRVSHIIVRCSCGQVIELACQY
ncbi:MAG: hypothetical protein ABSD58_12390 [Verrucomicrobiia bacterium]